MHKRINTQVRHRERYDHWRHERPGANQPFQSGSPALIQSVKRTFETWIVFAHQHHLNKIAS
jgi:hypothetical protein